MPKRMISDAIWKSKKIRQVEPAESRVEYTWIIAAVEDNGVFEYDPETLWAQAYALARPGWTPEFVKELLDEFVRVGLLLKYEAEGKTWCYLVGSEKEGRLPPPSQRYSKLPLPSAKEEPSHTLGAPYGEPRVDIGALYGSNGDAVIGIGLGNGSGIGSVSGLGNGESLPIALTSADHSAQKKTEDTERQETKQQAVHGQSINICITLAEYLYTCMKEHNPVAFNSAPTKWKQFWSSDIDTLLPVYSEKQLRDMITESQINPRFKKLVVRGAGLVKMAEVIYDHLPNHGEYSAKASPVDNAGEEDVEGKETAFDKKDSDFADKHVPDVPYVAARWKDRFSTEVNFKFAEERLERWDSIDLFRAFYFVDTRPAWRKFVDNSPVRFNKYIDEIMEVSTPGNPYRDPPSECDVEMNFSDHEETYTQTAGESKEQKNNSLAPQTALPLLVAVDPDDEQFPGKPVENDDREKPRETLDDNRDVDAPNLPGSIPDSPATKNAIPAPVEDWVDSARPDAPSSDSGQRQFQSHQDSIPDSSASTDDEDELDYEVENEVKNKSVPSIDSKDLWDWLSPLKDVWKDVSDRPVCLADLRHVLRDEKSTLPENNLQEYLADVIRWTMVFWPKRGELKYGSMSFARRFKEIQHDYSIAMGDAEKSGEHKEMFVDPSEDL